MADDAYEHGFFLVDDADDATTWLAAVAELDGDAALGATARALLDHRAGDEGTRAIILGALAASRLGGLVPFRADWVDFPERAEGDIALWLVFYGPHEDWDAVERVITWAAAQPWPGLAGDTRHDPSPEGQRRWLVGRLLRVLLARARDGVAVPEAIGRTLLSVEPSLPIVWRNAAREIASGGQPYWSPRAGAPQTSTRPAPPGSLTLADPAAGGLSLADDPALAHDRTCSLRRRLTGGYRARPRAWRALASLAQRPDDTAAAELAPALADWARAHRAALARRAPRRDCACGTAPPGGTDWLAAACPLETLEAGTTGPVSWRRVRCPRTGITYRVEDTPELPDGTYAHRSVPPNTSVRLEDASVPAMLALLAAGHARWERPRVEALVRRWEKLGRPLPGTSPP